MAAKLAADADKPTAQALSVGQLGGMGGTVTGLDSETFTAQALSVGQLGGMGGTVTGLDSETFTKQALSVGQLGGMGGTVTGLDAKIRTCCTGASTTEGLAKATPTLAASKAATGARQKFLAIDIEVSLLGYNLGIRIVPQRWEEFYNNGNSFNN